MSSFSPKMCYHHFISNVKILEEKGGDPLTTTISCSISIVSTIAFVMLWFWVVWRELYEKQKMVEAAKYQLIASLERCNRVRDGPEREEGEEILKRSQSIYRQSVGNYNKTLCKPWNIVPALFLGFRRKNEADNTTQNETKQRGSE